MYTIFDQFADITYFVTDVDSGGSEGAYSSNNLSFDTGDNPEVVTNNRLNLCRQFNVDPSALFIPDQTHSNNIAIVTKVDTPLLKTDALITNTKGFCIAILTADCVPIIVYNAKQKVISTIHVGWKGIINNIIPLTIEKMIQQFGGKTEHYFVGIGPSISKKNYEVSEDVSKKFDDAFPRSLGIVDRKQGSKPHIDLVMAARIQLISCGIPQLNIESCGECTFTNTAYFSARRQGFKSGRFASGIILNKN